MYTESASQSISDLVPAKCYNYLLPKGKFNLPRISYYFEHKMANTVDDSEYEEIFRRVEEWQARWKKTRRPYLRYQKSWSTIRISDGRGEKPRTRVEP